MKKYTVVLFTIFILANFSYSEIFVLNYANGTVDKYSDSGMTIKKRLIVGLSKPRALTVHDDYIYVVQESGSVKKYTTSGSLVNSHFITDLFYPAGISISGNYIYLVNNGDHFGTVGKYALDGSVVKSVLISNLGNPIKVLVRGDELFVCEWRRGIVGKYTTSGIRINSNFISGLNYPAGLTFNENGDLIVSTRYNGAIVYDSLTGAETGVHISNPYHHANDLEYLGDDKLLLACNYGGEGGDVVGLFTTSGQVIDASFITGLRNPIDIAVTKEPIIPVADAGMDLQLSADDQCGASVILDGSGSYHDDPNTILKYRWFYNDELYAKGVEVIADLEIGEYVFTLFVKDGTSRSLPDEVVITVADNTPPELTVAVDKQILWPVNNKMVKVIPSIEAFDNCSSEIAIKLIDIACNQQSEGDIEITDDGIFLRAKRDAKNKEPRIYTIVYKATDEAGNEITATTEVMVFHDRRTVLLK